MAVKTKAVLQLLLALGEHTGENLDYPGFGRMFETLDTDEVSQKYLDDTYRDVRRAIEAGKDKIRKHTQKLDLIAGALGYKNFRQFEMEITRPADPVLKNTLGNWWSIARANVGDTLFKAPVRIFEDADTGICIQLRGKENLFRGKVQFRAGCLFCELDSGKDKKLYVVIRGSVHKETPVLQGTFAGISSTGDPIGGRELWVREKKLAFKDMKWEELHLVHSPLDARINRYFESRDKNCIKIDNRADLG